MAHEVETMVFQGQVPWHGLGTPITDATTFQEGFELAGLDWMVDTKPLWTEDGVKVDHRAAYRTSDGRILGVVGPRWTPLQNREAFDIFEPLIDSGELKLHTAGSLRNGERIWCLLQMTAAPSEIVKGDEISKFVLLSNGHDGKLAVRMGFTPIRVVCANTEALARNHKASKLIRVRHNRFVKDNCEKLRDIMNLANAEFETTAEQYRMLAGRSISAKDLTKYVKVVLDIDTKKSDDDLSTRKKNIIDRVLWYFENGRGQDLEGVKGTWWAGYNAVTEYVNHEFGRNNNNRMDSVWFGQNQTLMTKALDQALAMSA
jgi:phage/plasmid-like protein (TIGR03299 family)